MKIPRSVFFLGLVSFFNDVAAEMVYPIVPIFLTSVLGAPVAILGFIEGVAEATAAGMKFVSGYISDRLNKRKIFVVGGYSFSTLSKLVIGLAASWHYVLFARFIDRLGKGVRTSARDSILLQNTNAQNRGFIFGFHRAFDSAGAVLGPIAALILLSLLKENIRLIFFIAFIPSLIGVLLLILFVKEKKNKNNKEKGNFTHNDKIFADRFLSEGRRGYGTVKVGIGGDNRYSKLNYKTFINFGATGLYSRANSGARKFYLWVKKLNPSFKLFFLISILFALGNSSDAFLILRSKQLGLTTSLIIVTYMLYNFSQTIFAAPFGRLSDKIGARRVYAAGLLVFAFVYFLFGIIDNSFYIWFLFPIYGLYIAATDGVSKAYISEFIKEEQSGTYFGLYQTGIALASFFASFFAGILWNKISPSATFYYGSLMSMVAFLVLAYGKLVRRI